ncbi:MAG: hypothetical protein WCK84_06020 [Bacteroidota bacterium]
MSELEKFINKHQNEFDTNEPDAGHFDRFESRLKEHPEMFRSGLNRSVMLKIAALILILISVSVFIFELATREIKNKFASEKSGSDLPLEIREAVQYYDNQTTAQLGVLGKLASNNKEAFSLSESALKEIGNLDLATTDLKNTLSTNPGNEHILDAIIRNQQMKEVILNNIITQLSQSQK